MGGVLECARERASAKHKRARGHRTRHAHASHHATTRHAHTNSMQSSAAPHSRSVCPLLTSLRMIGTNINGQRHAPLGYTNIWNNKIACR
eukprot:5510182-Prymnesium_polylepis.1